MRKFKQLSYEERVAIQTLKRKGESIRSIAKELGRSPNTISYELREKKVKDVYNPKKAHHKSYVRRYLSKRECLKIATNKELKAVVEQLLKQRVSPERISGYLGRFGYWVSSKAIYKYAYHRCFEYCLFWSWNKKNSGRKRKNHQSMVDGRRYIEERPEEDGTGHYEADFIVSSHNSYCLLVVVDRFSRYTEIRKLPNRKHATVTRAFKNIFKDKSVKTLTLDNDIAFNCWKQLPGDVYFTHPYCSWEKGLVENTNRWIRCFVPKRSDIKYVSNATIQSIQYWLNSSPRQCLGFRSSEEVLYDN